MGTIVTKTISVPELSRISTEPVGDYLLKYQLDGNDPTITAVGGEALTDFRSFGSMAKPDYKSRWFNGTSQYLNADADSGIVAVGTGAFSVSVRINTVNKTTFKSIFCTNTVPATSRILLEKNTPGTISFNTGSFHTTTVNVADGKWHLVTVTCSGANGTGKIYIDGVEDVPARFTCDNYNITDQFLSIAARPGGINPFDGGIDDVRFYDKELSQSEITSLNSYSKEISPLLVGTPVLYLDSQDQTKITDTLGDVSLWEDKSTSGNDASQGVGGDTPSTLTHKINGINVIVNPDGDTRFLELASDLTLSDFSIFTVLESFSETSDSASNRRAILGDRGNNDSYISFVVSTDPYVIVRSEDSGGTTSSATFTSEPSLIEKLLFSAVNIKNTSIDFTLNGDKVAGDTPYSNDMILDSIFRGYDFGQYWQGKIGDIVIYNTALSELNEQKVKSLNAWKFGLQSNLSESNPWKYVPFTG